MSGTGARIIKTAVFWRCSLTICTYSVQLYRLLSEMSLQRQQDRVVVLLFSAWGRCSNGLFFVLGWVKSCKKYLKGIFAAKKLLMSAGYSLVPGGSFHPQGFWDGATAELPQIPSPPAVHLVCLALLDGIESPLSWGWEVFCFLVYSISRLLLWQPWTFAVSHLPAKMIQSGRSLVRLWAAYECTACTNKGNW